MKHILTNPPGAQFARYASLTPEEHSKACWQKGICFVCLTKSSIAYLKDPEESEVKPLLLIR